MLKLTKVELFNHYVDWYNRYGLGRNEDDLRFGQWIWIHYNEFLHELKSKQPEEKSDGFSTENAWMAYECISSLFPYESTNI
jgi:hypothetical protein